MCTPISISGNRPIRKRGCLQFFMEGRGGEPPVVPGTCATCACGGHPDPHPIPTSSIPPSPAGVYAQERAPTPKTTGWFKFLLWEGGTTWDAFFTWCACRPRVAPAGGARGVVQAPVLHVRAGFCHVY